MLARLQIQNLAIIDDLTLDFHPGFTAMTGETGAGKSIVIGALNLILGERASSDDVRTGCERAEVQAQFQINNNQQLLDLLHSLGQSDESTNEGELIIRREVSAAGKSRCQINGRLIPLSQLRQIGNLLVDLHGQHQHQSLLHVELHRDILDAFGGNPIKKAHAAYLPLYTRIKEILNLLRIKETDARQIERQRDMLQFQMQEISDAELEPGEDNKLETERQRLQHAEALGHAAAQGHQLLYENPDDSPTADDILRQAQDNAHHAASLDPTLKNLAERLEAAHAEIVDIAETWRAYGDNLEHDPQRLQQIDDRLDLIHKLKRKYGDSIEEILQAYSQFEIEWEAIKDNDSSKESLQSELADLQNPLRKATEKLTAAREKAATAFSKGLRKELAELEMPRVQFQVKLDAETTQSSKESDTTQNQNAPSLQRPDGSTQKLYEWGAEQVEFLISANAGEALKPLRRVASGGELSRVMLALKVLMRNQNPVPTLVFDEIDTGISGRTGVRIAEKLQALGANHQVLCITHLAQIAARAPHHFSVQKKQTANRSTTQVQPLDQDQRLAEISRLLGGQEQSEIAQQHARELLGLCET